MEEKKERLNKYLAACGVCSRREADRLIEAGKVTVDGETATMGMQVNGQEKIIVNKKPVFGKNEKVVLAYYKPIGVTCTEKDRHAERKICDELNYPVRLTYAGRLDKDSEGLLIMTNDGDLIERMMRLEQAGAADDGELWLQSQGIETEQGIEHYAGGFGAWPVSCIGGRRIEGAL